MKLAGARPAIGSSRLWNPIRTYELQHLSLALAQAAQEIARGIHPALPRSRRRRWRSSPKEVVEGPNGVGDVRFPVFVGIASIFAKPPGPPAKQVIEREDRVRDMHLA